MQAYSLSLFYFCFFSLYFTSRISHCPQNSYYLPILSSFSSMAAHQYPSVSALVVYRNSIHNELIRTVHAYRLDGGAEQVAEREYLFREHADYEELRSPGIIFSRHGFDVSAHSEGMVNGVWDCIYVFDGGLAQQPHLENIPQDLSIFRNPKLASIPSLANDLDMIFCLGHKSESGDPSEILTEESSNMQDDVGHLSRGTQQVPLLDLNSLPYPEAESEDNNPTIEGAVEKKLKRAATKDIARLALEDLAKYFNVPIVQASKNLNVGLTVLKKKCREFGIPRWPHRKIKSLDSLIRDLQGEVKRQQEEDEVAAMAVAKRQRMIESEKDNIEKKPFLDIHWETKKFRQDVFKRRHRARAHENQSRTLSLF